MSTTATEFETRTGAASNRFDGIKRDYSMADVERLSGSVRIEHTLARNGANKLWERLHTEDYVHSLGAMTGNQAMQMVRAGLGPHHLEAMPLPSIADVARKNEAQGRVLVRLHDQSVLKPDRMPV